MRIALLIILTLCGLSAATLDHINLGTAICGPKITAADLEGRVVIFEYWGIHCPPCLANIPHVTEMSALDPDRDRLVVIANQCQEPGQTKEVWTSKGGGSNVAVIDQGELPGAEVSGIPRVFVFDGEGKQVFDGHPGKLTIEQVKTWLATANGPIAGKGPFQFVAKQARAINDRKQPIGNDVSSLRKLAAKDGPAKTEATEVLSKTETWIEKQNIRINTLKEEDPAGAFQLCGRVASLLKGDTSAKAFEDQLKQWRKDKVLMREVQAADALAEVCVQADKIGLSKGDAEARQRKQAVNQIRDGLNGISTQFSGTKAAAKAQALLTQWQL